MTRLPYNYRFVQNRQCEYFPCHKDVDIEIIGKGMVDTYSPSIGTELKGVKKIKLYLKEK